MNGFQIGISSLAAGRRGLDVVGQNIANAATRGYHRQALNLVSRVVDGVKGIGVDVASITRYAAPAVRTTILRGNADQNWAASRLGIQRQVETSFGSSPGTIGDGIEAFFNQIEQLTSRPDNAAVRRAVLGSAQELAARFNSAATDIDRVRNGLIGQVAQSVNEINDFAARIAQLNTRIANAEAQGNQANDLRDQRDQLIDDLSQKIDIRTVDQPYGVVNVIATGAAVVVGDFPNTFQSTLDPSGQLVITQAGSTQPVKFASGELGGMLQSFNQDLPATRTRLDTLAREIIARMNGIQATGLGTSGPVTSLNGSISVADPTLPLATQNLPFPMQAGQLVISVTDTTTGNRTNATIAIDPATDSLNDVAAAITAATGGQVQATVSSPANTLQLQAQPGYQFDFAGRDTNPPGGGAVANTDTAGLLTGLGVGGLFNGSDAISIEVSPALLADPGLLAASRTGLPGDATNLERIAAVRDQQVIGGRTLLGEYGDLAATVGLNVKELDDIQSAHAAVLQNLNAQEQAVSGVDVNEELVYLLEYQRMVDSASKYISVVNSALDSIFEMLN
jgi:flagellar hook-associated protein FlgK